MSVSYHAVLSSLVWAYFLLFLSWNKNATIALDSRFYFSKLYMVETLWKGRNSREQIKGGCLFWSFFSFLELISIFLSIWYNKIKIYIILLHSVFIWSNLVEKWPQTRNTKTRDSLDFARFFAGFVQKTIVNCPRLQWSFQLFFWPSG